MLFFSWRFRKLHIHMIHIYYIHTHVSYHVYFRT